MAREVSRRRALQIAALGAVGTAVGGLGTWRTVLGPTSSSLTGEPGSDLAEPPVRESSNGVLEVELRAGSGVTLAGRRTHALGYNGSSPGPTLRLRPGDMLRVDLVNDLDAPTNLHTHGLHVSPGGQSDNVFRRVEPGERARYEYDLPADHPAGTFWYHPHHHGHVADQVFGGLLGALVVAGQSDPEVDRDRVLVVSDTTLTAGGHVAGVSMPQVMAGREGDLLMVNGQLQPRIAMTSGTLERWRVVNACASRFLRLRLDGHSWALLGYDGQALGDPREQDEVVLAPGNRADVLVRPSRTGSFGLRTLSYDRGAVGMMSAGPGGTSPETDLATVQVEDSSSAAGSLPAPLPRVPRRVGDLRSVRVDRERSLAFTMSMGMGMSFGFDGREFDPARTDQRLDLGTVEEWTIGNDTPMDHPFHLHVWPMQVVEAEDVSPDDPPDWRDVVVVPARSRVRVRIRVADYGGRTVYHCHVLDHEDRGMMGTVLASGAPDAG